MATVAEGDGEGGSDREPTDSHPVDYPRDGVRSTSPTWGSFTPGLVLAEHGRDGVKGSSVTGRHRPDPELGQRWGRRVPRRSTRGLLSWTTSQGSPRPSRYLAPAYTPKDPGLTTVEGSLRLSPDLRCGPERPGRKRNREVAGYHNPSWTVRGSSPSTSAFVPPPSFPTKGHWRSEGHPWSDGRTLRRTGPSVGSERAQRLTTRGAEPSPRLRVSSV